MFPFGVLSLDFLCFFQFFTSLSLWVFCGWHCRWVFSFSGFVFSRMLVFFKWLFINSLFDDSLEGGNKQKNVLGEGRNRQVLKDIGNLVNGRAPEGKHHDQKPQLEKKNKVEKESLLRIFLWTILFIRKFSLNIVKLLICRNQSSKEMLSQNLIKRREMRRANQLVEDNWRKDYQGRI